MKYIIRRCNDSELTHWGVLGMKWGVRRYQNEDGTLTNAGEKRYSSTKRVERVVKKDAKRFIDAKMFYGKTAGTKRKLLKAELDRKKKLIPGYNDLFEQKITEVDTAKSAQKAVRTRHRKDAAYRTRVTTKQILGVTGPLSVAAASILYAKNKEKVDNFVVNKTINIANALKNVVKKGG